jgi:hypothetical protein
MTSIAKHDINTLRAIVAAALNTMRADAKANLAHLDSGTLEVGIVKYTIATITVAARRSMSLDASLSPLEVHAQREAFKGLVAELIDQAWEEERSSG